jgi:hypothetical protein
LEYFVIVMFVVSCSPIFLSPQILFVGYLKPYAKCVTLILTDVLLLGVGSAVHLFALLLTMPYPLKS